MTKNKKLNHMLALTEEVNILTQRLKPTTDDAYDEANSPETGYIHTTISTLRGRIGELEKELCDEPRRVAGSEEISGMYTDDEVKGWEEAVRNK